MVGKDALGVGVVLDGIGVYKYYRSGANDPNAVHPAKAGLNTFMGRIGLYNPFAGELYFGVDAFYPGGWQGYAEDYDRIQKATEQILVPQFITAPFGSQKF